MMPADNVSNSIEYKDLKKRVNLLAKLTSDISKDATTQALVLPRVKKWMADFKEILGSRKISRFCSTLTKVFFKLLKCINQCQPDDSYEFCCDWRDIIALFNSSQRAKAFIDNILKFKLVIQHLKTAGNRWHQLIFLGLIQLYTKRVQLDDIKQSNLDFLVIIKEIISLPHHQKISIRMMNTFLSEMNNRGDSILSFNPYKVICENATYIVTDYDLWIDYNLKNKVITFVAQSETDKTDNIYGVASTIGMQITSNQHTIIVNSNWCLTSESESKSTNGQTKIIFCFSSRVHNSVLESKLKSVLKVVECNRPILKKDSFLKTVVGVNTSRVADESRESPLNSKVLPPCNPENLAIVNSKNVTNDASVVREKPFIEILQRIKQLRKRHAEGSVEAGSSNESNRDESIRKNKRRKRELPAEPKSNDDILPTVQKCHVECLPQLANRLRKADTFIIRSKEENALEQNVKYLVQPSSQNKIVGPKEENARQENVTCLVEHLSQYDEVSTAEIIHYDIQIYRESWPIRKFVKSLRSEEQEEVESTQINDNPDNSDISDIYESVSQKL